MPPKSNSSTMAGNKRPWSGQSSSNNNNNNNNKTINNTKKITPNPHMLAYEASLAQLTRLQQKLQEQSTHSMNLERGALDYYYTHIISLEPTINSDDEDEENNNNNNYIISNNNNNNNNNNAWHQRSSSYYFKSVVAVARRGRRAVARRLEKKLKEGRRLTGALEIEMKKRNLILENARGAAREAAAALNFTQKKLLEIITATNETQEKIKEVKEEMIKLQALQVVKEEGIETLKEERRRQAANVEATRLIVIGEQEELLTAQGELQKREKIVEELRETIVRLTRRRKQ